MNYEDERYARLYVRDTVTWKRWDWRARFVFMSMLRKADRAGVIDVGGEAEDGLAVILEMPVDIVRDGMHQLEASGTVRRAPTSFVMPNFMHAQECKQSDTLRQQISRERRRSSAIDASYDSAVTDGHRPSEDVTDSHSMSQTVTDGHSFRAVPSRAVPSQTERKRRASRGDAVASTPRRLIAMSASWRPRTGECPDGISFDRELKRFRDHYISEGKRKADWEASWRNWLRRAEEFAKRDNGTLNQRSNGRAGRFEPTDDLDYSSPFATSPATRRLPWEDE